jgi:putative zinc finger protein
MLSCRHATRLVSDGLDRSLSLAERLSLGVHLLGCPQCARFRRAACWLHRALASPPAEVRLPAEVRERIRRALERAARDG